MSITLLLLSVAAAAPQRPGSSSALLAEWEQPTEEKAAPPSNPCVVLGANCCLTPAMEPFCVGSLICRDAKCTQGPAVPTEPAAPADAAAPTEPTEPAESDTLTPASEGSHGYVGDECWLACGEKPGKCFDPAAGKGFCGKPGVWSGSCCMFYAEGAKQSLDCGSRGCTENHCCVEDPMELPSEQGSPEARSQPFQLKTPAGKPSACEANPSTAGPLSANPSSANPSAALPGVAGTVALLQPKPAAGFVPPLDGSLSELIEPPKKGGPDRLIHALPNLETLRKESVNVSAKGNRTSSNPSEVGEAVDASWGRAHRL